MLFGLLQDRTESEKVLSLCVNKVHVLLKFFCRLNDEFFAQIRLEIGQIRFAVTKTAVQCSSNHI